MPQFTTLTARAVALRVNDIDTDQIIPARFLKATDKAGMGDHLFADWRYNADGSPREEFPLNQPEAKAAHILVSGDNFGCGSSREHAPIALGAAGAEAVVAESFARIFFRNCVATGELYPVETPTRLVDGFRTGDEAILDLDASTVTNRRSGSVLTLRPLGDAGPVIAAGGLFAYARKTGMIAAPADA